MRQQQAVVDAGSYTAVLLDEEDDDARRQLDELRADPRIEFVDLRSEQAAGLRVLRPPADPALFDEPTRWAYFPWRRTVVGVLGPRAFRAVRLDRNRNLITAAEQDRLGALRIGVAGLSVGHVIAHTLAAQGMCGELRLADFDALELSNLNRVPASLFDLGENKAKVAARRIAELDPYLPIWVFPQGITTESVDDFLDGLDVVVEECDSLDMKAIVREGARARRLPVLMATSDRGLVDVERFDLDPGRPILHGLLGQVDAAMLSQMTARDKIPHMLGHLDVPRASSRGAASMIEVGRTLATWPQLAGDVTMGAGAVAEAVRRIGLREELGSGRIRLDVATAFDNIADPWPPVDPPDNDSADEPASASTGTATSVIDIVAAAAERAPSGGNAQPWQIETAGDALTIRVATNYRATVNIGFRGSAVAVGAALFNARVAAAAQHALGPVQVDETPGAHSPLRAVLRLGDGDDPDLAGRYVPMLQRETNRHYGRPGRITAATAEALIRAATSEGGWLRLLTTPDDLAAAATVLADADRVRYLTPRLHADMVSELRWPGDPFPDTGIDVRSLELDAGELAMLEILRRHDVMAHLADWDAGAALGEQTYERILNSSAIAVVGVSGRNLVDYARGGSALESVWIAAEQCGLAVQPVFPVFLHAHDDAELTTVSEPFAGPLARLRQGFSDLSDCKPCDALILVLRFTEAPPASVRSRRRPVGQRLGS